MPEKRGEANRSDALGPAECFRLPLHLKQVGAGKHRSGWPFVMAHLRKFHHPDGILLDDFVERSFLDGAVPQGWQESWVGIFHHPPGLPEWLDPSAPLHRIISTAAFQASLPHLRGAIALSEHLGGWLRTALRCPVLVLKHPTEIPELRFSIESWNKTRRVVQVGWYARNIRAIYQVQVPDGYQKLHLVKDRLKKAIALTDQFSPYRSRPWVGKVDVLRRLEDPEYDNLMASSLVLCEYWDVSASNTVVEAIARCTPLLLNRHPALEEYLGAHYPLFFDELKDVPALIEDPARIRDAWRYLFEMDKSWMSANSFAQDVRDFVHKVSTIQS